ANSPATTTTSTTNTAITNVNATIEIPTDEGYNDGYEEPKQKIEIPTWITQLSEEQRAVQ
ncbi:2117_t:CDS:2, partial [Ambispora leptoticha]